MAMVFVVAAEIERALIVAVKKASEVQLGRPKGVGKSKLDAYRIEIEALLNNDSIQQFIARRYGTTKQNLANWLKRNNRQRPRSLKAI